ncbi:MAG: hypothetical protein M1826_001086, partial [Phylliscum demangeonii]
MQIVPSLDQPVPREDPARPPGDEPPHATPRPLDGFVPDEHRPHADRPHSPATATAPPATSPTRAVVAAIDDASLAVSDRMELIERIKRGESPSWRPNQSLESYYRDLQKTAKPPASRESSPPQSRPTNPFGSTQATAPAADERVTSPWHLQRPRSALHSGDFTESGVARHDAYRQPAATAYGPRDERSWSPSSSAQLRPPRPALSLVDPHPDLALPYRGPFSYPDCTPPAPQPALPFPGFLPALPRSPLAIAASTADGPVSPIGQGFGIPIGRGQSQSSRRHTLPPHTLTPTPSSPPDSLPTAGRSYLSHDRSAPPRQPFQGHAVRRSLTSSYALRQHTLSLTPAPPHSSRRPSLSSEVSPLHHASMVGSYEESILQGRMSTAPSKPLDFVAQIGVLGLGKCKPHLRCPAHVLVPFPAVFYSYARASPGRTAGVEDAPSPYVGLIDLENTLSHPKDERRKRMSGLELVGGPRGGRGDLGGDDGDAHAANARSIAPESESERRLRRKKKRRSRSASAPPGGSYRIPQTGQLQIVIKNPNKTAVKLFLVPYDLQGMEPGTKTFIRQRSYSTGPIMEMPVPSPHHDHDHHAPASVDEPPERPTLRYMIHLHICSPARDRFFLYKSIRIVFANRVPDGKERLRNEIQLPEPRYSGYKAGYREASFAGGEHHRASGFAA